MRYLILLLLVSGCAFKGGTEETASGAVQAKLIGRSVTLSWQGEAGSASVVRAVEGSGNYYLNEPVTIPDVAPDSLRITFNSPIISGGKILQEPKVFISDATDEKDVSNPVRLKGAMEGSDIEVTGLRTFFSVDKQQKGIVSIAFQNAITGEQEATLRLILVSPPISSEFQLLGREAVQEKYFWQFSANELRLDLISVVRIRNTGIYRQEYLLPNELKGSMRKDFRRYNAVEHYCKTDLTQEAWTDNYPTRFFLLPLEDSLEEDWIVRISDSERSFYLDPEQEVLLGLYGAGEQLASFVDNGIPGSRHVVKTVIDYCEEPCSSVLLSEPRDPPERCFPRKQIRHYKDVPIGLDTSGARWALEAESIRLRIRNGFLPRSDDPASRMFSFLPAENGIL